MFQPNSLNLYGVPGVYLLSLLEVIGPVTSQVCKEVGKDERISCGQCNELFLPPYLIVRYARWYTSKALIGN